MELFISWLPVLQIWPQGKVLTQQTRACWWSSALFRHEPSVSPAPFSWPSLLFLRYSCLSLRFHCPARSQTSDAKHSGTPKSLLLSGINERGRVPYLFRGRRVRSSDRWSRWCQCVTLYNLESLPQGKGGSFQCFSWSLWLHWGLSLVLVSNTFLGYAISFCRRERETSSWS